ncbi:C39 family peptidase [Microbacteriaceae bacterium 4G12]
MARAKEVYKYALITMLLFVIHTPVESYIHSSIQKTSKKIVVQENPKKIEGQTIQNQTTQNKQDNTNTPVVQDKAMLTNVPLIQQLPDLDRGCEVTSLAMLFQYAGKSVDKMTLANEIDKVPFHDGDMHGNPNEGFVGNIYTFSESGYGVYHEPIFKLAEKYLPNQAVDLTGKSIDEVYKMLQAGAPVWVITNATFAPLDESEFETWNTDSGSIQITYREHSVLITGYDQNSVYVNDPLEDQPNIALPRAAFEEAWAQMGSQAISYVVKKS